ncbi:[SSU ribosomal protein S18P]-alanine acetyltransferase [Methanococcus maripaludis C5]|uniref:[SSU ribosomal protein S18P]-alanine acetyltransferase n=1 Tax=Methanococcus maripaludis (strain C5 / ATCC BAA-1333) TaxID=402880 RepID=A4FWG8_METM5|nr:ribosomal protein S18-alanine N-acetyltransferase [Methanococcus maripaludis]ABO34543.1 [SSU ribosomal protein S18P]-alanine acetyltransferase [Methanococcus maripaludis C5]
MIINIRKFREHDLKRVMEIEKESFDKNYPEFLMMHIYTSFPDGFLVAETEDGKIVGYIIALMEWGNGHVVSIAVDSAYQNYGIGNALLSATENFLFNECHAKHCVLEVRFDNKKAREFYYKRNYVDRKVLYNYYDDGADAILMIKRRFDLSGNYPIFVNMW